MTTAVSQYTSPISLAERAVLSNSVAVVTGKGGILKTATTAALAAWAAFIGLRVLFVDMDSQATGSKREFGMEATEHDDDGASLVKALQAALMEIELAPKVVEAVRVYPSGGQVDVIVGGRKLDAAMEAITTIANNPDDPMTYSHILAKVLAPLAGDYDLVVIDNDPKNKPVRLMVLEAAQASYAPVDYDIAAYKDGLNVLRKEIADARIRNPYHVFLGAVGGRMPTATMYAWRIKQDGKGKGDGGRMAQIAEAMTPILGDTTFDVERQIIPGFPKIFDSMIRAAAGTAADCRAAGLTIVDFLLAKFVTRPGESEADARARLFKEHPILEDYNGMLLELLAGMTAAREAHGLALAA